MREKERRRVALRTSRAKAKTHSHTQGSFVHAQTTNQWLCRPPPSPARSLCERASECDQVKRTRTRSREHVCVSARASICEGARTGDCYVVVGVVVNITTSREQTVWSILRGLDIFILLHLLDIARAFYIHIIDGKM